MDRLEEVNLKHDQLRHLMRQHGADGLLLRRAINIAWFTGGADPSLVVSNDAGSYAILVTPEQRIVVTDQIEELRLRAEEHLEDYGFDFNVSPWYARDPLATPCMTTDGEVEDDLQRLRWVLTDPEKDRTRALGRDTAAAIDEAARAVQPGDSEFEMAARIDAACKRRGGVAVVNLIATDERISQFRHPMATSKRIERLAMLVVCMRREGLVVSSTRFVHFGPVPDELQEKMRRTATIDATVIAATRPGRTLGEIFDDLTQAYAAQHEAGQWTLHHQGGIGGYAPRERLATPGDATLVQANQLFGWNPSIVGCKSEDSALITGDGFEIVSQALGSWPMVDVTIDGQTIQRAGILEL